MMFIHSAFILSPSDGNKTKSVGYNMVCKIVQISENVVIISVLFLNRSSDQVLTFSMTLFPLQAARTFTTAGLLTLSSRVSLTTKFNVLYALYTFSSTTPTWANASMRFPMARKMCTLPGPYGYGMGISAGTGITALPNQYQAGIPESNAQPSTEDYYRYQSLSPLLADSPGYHPR